MRVFLLSAAPAGPERAHLDLGCLQDSARLDRFGVHAAVDSPADADLILFVETSVHAGPYFEQVRRHPLYRSRRDESYLFCSTDRFIPMLPGVYAAVERSWYWPHWTRPGHYVNVREHGQMRYEERGQGERKYLFSFIGSAASHPVRRRLLSVDDTDALMVDTGSRSLDPGRLTPEAYERRYADSVKNSAFVLAPRGGGPASFRLFEAMMLGRVPVIISDQWVPPIGPDWERFSIRVDEADLHAIPSLLQARASEAAQMGEAARAAWVDWCSESVSFHRVVESCLDLTASASSRTGVRRYAPHLQLLRPYHAARWVAKRFGHGRDARR